MRRRLVSGTILLALLVCAPARPSVFARQQPDVPIFTGATDLVVLHVTVTDRRHHYVGGLPADAFTVVDEGRVQPIDLFTSEDAPVTAGLVIDSSVSMWSIRRLLIAGAVGFAEASNARDEIFALAFNDRVWSALPADQPFTSNTALLRDALTRAIAPEGRTALFDAVDEAMTYAQRGHHERKALVLISDGGDNASTRTFEDIRTRTQRSNIVIYALAIADPLDHDARPKLLKQLAEASGGEMFSPRSADEMGDGLKAIASDIRHAYTLGYTPGSSDGRFHRLRVLVKSPAGESLRVRTRTGYLAAPAAPGRAAGDAGEER